jgi:L,D-transpeptidase catalytic domain
MSLPKVMMLLITLLFSVIGVAAFFKKGTKQTEEKSVVMQAPIEVDLSKAVVDEQPIYRENDVQPPPPSATALLEKEVPHANRIHEFFNKRGSKFPIVETITYRSKVAWQKGRPAWLSDYASYYSTSRHFIARSLNGKPEYFKQDVVEGDSFNILRKDKNITFYLVVDTSRNRMWFYYIDHDANQRVLVKDYLVGLGRKDPTKISGLLTPLGKYSLGNKIALYKPKMTGYHYGQKVEMIRVFGTRWIPFNKEISNTTGPSRGLGIHGIPWKANAKGELVEERESLGKHASDGCIRLATEDIEELFAVIITRPTTIEIVNDFYAAKPPGIEK